tara:strand:- start:121789 stop:122847 length:1059 start_codon:yes stop_codon:yes gene_type:complete
MKILVIQQKMIGDVLTSSILFEALRSKYPEAELHYLIHKHTVPVVQNNPFIDKFIFDLQDSQGNTISFIKFAARLRSENYDIVIDAYSKISSAFLSFYSGAKVRIGIKKSYTSYLYNHSVKNSNKAETAAGLAIENRMRLLAPLSKDFPKEIKPKIYLKEAEIASAKAKLENSDIDLSKPIIMIGVLGSSELKTYPLPYLAKLLQTIVEETNAQLLLNYIPDQKPKVEELLNNCDNRTVSHIFPEVYGENLREFIALTSFCDALIGNEGGAVNMAKALNKPTFSIYSPWINPEAWASYPGKKQVAVHLKNYKPQLYKSKDFKAMKKESIKLYEELNPEFIKKELLNFLSNLN